MTPGRLLIAAVLATLIPLAAAQAGDVTVRVLNVKGSRGVVRAAVCTREIFLKPSCEFGASVPAHPGVVVLTVHDVSPGIYAVTAHHDANNNGVVDQNLLGIPTEGIGFSRDAPINFGPPHFDAAAFKVGDALVTIDITLKFE